MLYERKQLKELLYLKHRNDEGGNYIKYDDTILEKSLSPYSYKNKTMSDFLDRIQPLSSILLDNMNIIKNFKNYIVDKYYYKH